MKRLIIISDLWGGEYPIYIQKYIQLLEQQFVLKYYDACVLGEIDQSDSTEKSIHQQFVNGGIKLAVKNLMIAERDRVSILGFSIGGVIAWKAIQKGLACEFLCGVSSTRLRYETEKLNCPSQLIYGNQDSFKPSEQWFEQMNISFKILENQDHDLYKNEFIAQWISNELINRSLRQSDSTTIL